MLDKHSVPLDLCKSLDLYKCKGLLHHSTILFFTYMYACNTQLVKSLCAMNEFHWLCVCLSAVRVRKYMLLSYSAFNMYIYTHNTSRKFGHNYPFIGFFYVHCFLHCRTIIKAPNYEITCMELYGKRKKWWPSDRCSALLIVKPQ